MERKRKLVIVGDGNTGKTCLLTRFAKGEFPTDTEPTTFDTLDATILVDETHQISLGLWDTAGQEEYEKLRPLSYNDSDVVLLCFSIAAPDSMANIAETWMPEMKCFCPGVPLVLVGTKKDLRYSPDVENNLARINQHPVTYEEGLNCAKECGIADYIECSALNNDCVFEVFHTACKLTILSDKKKEKMVKKEKKQNEGGQGCRVYRRKRCLIM